MGFRGKLFWLYLLTFGFMASIASVLLLSFLQAKFLDLETTQARDELDQLGYNLDSEFSRLRDLTADWSNWDGLYTFAQGTNDAFLLSELTRGAMLSAKLDLIAVFDPRGKLLMSQALDLGTRQASSVEPFSTALLAVQAVAKQGRRPLECGLYNVPTATLLLCWKSIQRADHSGDLVGTVLMARKLSGAMLERMRKQSSVAFDIQPITSTAAAQAIQVPVIDESQTLKIVRNEQSLVVAELMGLTGQPTLEVQMHTPDNIRRNGIEVIRWVMLVMLLVVALNGLCLLIGVQWMLVKRLKSTRTELKAISSTSTWQKRITTSGSDELSGFAREVNRLLEVIHSQVESLESLTLTDVLTQIANRRAFDQRLKMEMDASARSGLPLALLALDVDYFKLYNDHYGHLAGDDALKALGKILLQTASRPTDLPARVGGEEFSILLPNTNLEGAEALARRLLDNVRERHIPHAYSLVAKYMTVSIGVTICGNETIDSFIARADAAMYQSKESGRNRLTVKVPEQE